MDVRAVPVEPGFSWSENTTPDSDDIEEIVRQRPISRIEYSLLRGRPRLMRPPIRRRLRMEEMLAARPYHLFAGSLGPVDYRGSFDGSDSSSSTHTAVNSATSSCTDPWSSTGFVEEEHVDMMLVPKLEPVEDDTDITTHSERGNGFPKTPGIATASTSVVVKRPRGRPRKKPKARLESLAKIAKGRSKTGCVTCRKWKKKCDETKPGCVNCEKNSVKCEGYPEKAFWMSGKEKAAAGTKVRRSQQSASELTASTAQIYGRVSLPRITLPPLIHGVETSGDKLFFHHYISKLSTIFTVEPYQDNAFKSMLLPIAAQHVGLMHSILALSSKHIDYRSSYGIKFLQDHPDVNVNALEERSQYHQNRAYQELNADIARQVQSHDRSTIPATLGQMICMVLQTLSDENPRGHHRWHLKAYKALTETCPPEDGEPIRFFHEFFQYHICADELICLPSEEQLRSNSDSDGWNLPSTVLQPAAVRMLGVHDGLFLYMSRITNIRNKVRINIQRGINPVVDYTSLYRAAQVDAGIREWKQPWPVGDPRDLSAMLYKQMMWVYLWRTIYPPKTTTWHPDPRITQAVNDSIRLLELFNPDDPSLTLVLAPAFVMGCAAFEVEQREPIRRAIAVVKAYMGYRNADTALVVLEEVWRLMDMRDERSWDWQWIANYMGIDFLAT